MTYSLNAEAVRLGCRKNQPTVSSVLACLYNCGVVVTAALHKAGKHMEDSIVAAYVALLVGTLILHSPVAPPYFFFFISIHTLYVESRIK